MPGMTCAKCGAQNPAGSSFCNACGSAIASPKRRPGCVARLTRWTLILIVATAVLSLALPGGCGHTLVERLPVLKMPLGDEQSTPYNPTPTLTDAQAAMPASDGQLVRYVVTAATDAAASNVLVDYVDTDARPAHTEVTLPWQHEAYLAPGNVARLVVETDAPVKANIAIDGAVRAQAAAESLAVAANAAPRWRAQVEVAITAP